MKKTNKRDKPASASSAIKAKCMECMNFNADGRRDCGIRTCPLYAWQPYKEASSAPILWWVKTKICDLWYAYNKARNTYNDGSRKD